MKRWFLVVVVVVVDNMMLQACWMMFDRAKKVRFDGMVLDRVFKKQLEVL